MHAIRTHSRLAAADVLDLIRIPHSLEEPLPRQWAKILKRSHEDLGPLIQDGVRRVLVATSYGFSPYMMACETVLAGALRLRGVQPYFLVCDHALPSCEWNRWGNNHPDPGEFAPPRESPWQRNNCHTCTSDLTAVLDNFPYPIERFSEMIQLGDKERLTNIVDSTPYEGYRLVVYKDINVGAQAFASTVRALRRATLEDTPYIRWLFRRYLLGALWVAELGERILEQVQPDSIIMVHGIYVTHGVLCELAQRINIPTVVWGASYRRDSIWLTQREALPFALAHEPISTWREYNMTPEEDNRLSDYLESKRVGSQDQITYNTNPIEDRDKIAAALGLDVARPIVSLYTNVIWDGVLFCQSRIFTDQLDWVFQTIDYFITHPQSQLVIRFHPAEARGLGTTQSFGNEIKARFSELPSNIKIIPPESFLSSYTLSEMSHAALIFESTIGMEIAARGIPIIVTADSFSRNKGFSFDPNSRQEYFNLLDQAIQGRLPCDYVEMVACARKFAYHVFFQKSIDFPQVHSDEPNYSLGLRLRFRKLTELEFGCSPDLDSICGMILHSSGLRMQL